MTAAHPAGESASDDRLAGIDFAWLTIAGRPRGRVIAEVADEIRRMPSLFLPLASGLALRDAGLSPAERSRQLQDAALVLHEAGLVPGWRDEACALLDGDETELARFERGAFRALGLQNRAVHVNGCLPDGRIWIARRSASKQSSPNKLDNMAAGAISAGESPMQCAVRELWEEAGVPAELATLTRLLDARVHSLRPIRHGIHDEVILCADLSLPEGFTPVCQDGEVAEFLCMTRDAVRSALADGQFSVEAGFVVADWLARTT